MKEALKIRIEFTHKAYKMFPEKFESIIKFMEQKTGKKYPDKYLSLIDDFTKKECRKLDDLIKTAISNYEDICQYLDKNYSNEILKINK